MRKNFKEIWKIFRILVSKEGGETFVKNVVEYYLLYSIIAAFMGLLIGVTEYLEWEFLQKICFIYFIANVFFALVGFWAKVILYVLQNKDDKNLED